MSPAGDPTDDALNLQPPSYIVVIDSGPHGSKAVRVARGAPPLGVVLGCVTGDGPHNSGVYVLRFKAYSAEETGFTPAMTVSVTSSSGRVALRLMVDDPGYHLESGDGVETLSVGYTLNTVDEIVIQIDMDSSRLSLNINCLNVTSDKPFLDAGFDDVHELSFQYPGSIVEGYGKYVVDDILICKK